MVSRAIFKIVDRLIIFVSLLPDFIFQPNVISWDQPTLRVFKLTTRGGFTFLGYVHPRSQRSIYKRLDKR